MDVVVATTKYPEYCGCCGQQITIAITVKCLKYRTAKSKFPENTWAGQHILGLYWKMTSQANFLLFLVQTDILLVSTENIISVSVIRFWQEFFKLHYPTSKIETCNPACGTVI